MANDISIPPTVQKPLLPAPKRLKKGKFEKTSDFTERVADAKEERQDEIQSLQAKYRKDVEARNKQILYKKRMREKTKRRAKRR